MSDMPVQMHINARRIAHYALNRQQILVHPVQIFFLIPNVAVHLLFKGAQLLAVHLRFGLRDRLGYLGIAAQINFLGIISTTGEGRINIHKVDADSLLLQISAGAHALAANNHIPAVAAHLLCFLHLVQRHSAQKVSVDVVRSLIAQRAPEII